MKPSVKNYSFQNSVLSFAILLCACRTFSQGIANYVNNASFEMALPSASLNPFEGAKYWGPLDSSVNNSHRLYSKSLGTVPYGFGGFQLPKTKDSYIGTTFYCDASTCGATEIRWYPRNRLKQILKPNKTYCAKYYVVNTNNSVIGINSFAAFFGGSWMDTTKYCTIPINYLTPQISYTSGIITDTLEWIAISGTFVAIGDEKYMVLGNYNSNPNTQTVIINPTYLPALVSDVLIDDVSLIEMDLPAYAGPDKNIIAGDSVYIGRESDVEIDESCIWHQMTSPTTSITIDTIAGLYVKPVVTTTYVVRQQLWCSGVKWDTVVVFMDAVGISETGAYQNDIKIFPNPASNFIEVEYSFDKTYPFIEVLFYNQLGELVLKDSPAIKNKKSTISISKLVPGVYSIEFKEVSGHTVRKRLIVSK